MTTDLRLAVLGDNIGYTLSPGMHQAALQRAGITGSYDIVDASAADLGGCVERLWAEGYTGFNVTIPHKEAIVGLMGRLDAEAADIGAVNTVRREATGWAGFNTDASGLGRLLAPHAIDGASAVVLGAGGMARAVVAALRPRCAHVVVVNRTLATAERLVGQGAERPAQRASVTALALDDVASLRTAIGDAAVVVNATSVGTGDRNRSPLPDGVDLPSGSLVCDAVYVPRDTALLRQAARSGCTVLDGLRLLAAQAADAFAVWTGVRIDDDLLRAAVPPAGFPPSAPAHTR